MKRYEFTLVILLIALMVAGCSGSSNPAGPSLSEKVTDTQAGGADEQTNLWGYYDVYVDVASQTATAVENRQAMFTANVVNFINGKPAGLGFHINGTPIGSGYVDVDIDVSITHPFPGLHQYDGYDVRGVFMGDGSANLRYNTDLIYPVLNVDQCMLDNPVGNYCGPDGYTSGSTSWNSRQGECLCYNTLKARWRHRDLLAMPL